jgi:hypothetical protein
MKITVESTTKIVHMNRIPCRVWEGHTERGVPVHVYIPRIAVASDSPAEAFAQFEEDLKEQRAPSPAVEAIPLRLIL